MKAMPLRRFDWALKTRGADLETWPERDGARALLQHSAQARTLFADALAAEPFLPEPSTPDIAGSRVLANLRRRLAAQTPLQSGLRWGALAVCATAGLALGQWLAAVPTPDALTMVQAALVP